MSSGKPPVVRRRAPRPMLSRLREVAAVLGWPSALSVAARWLVVRRYLAYEWDLRAPQPERASPPGVRVTVLRPMDIGALGAMDPRMTPREIERRSSEGQECLLGWIGDRLAHYRWQSMQPAYVSYLDRILRPLDRDLLVLDVHTRLDLRGRGVAGLVTSAGLNRGRSAGCTRAVWLIAWWNTPAHRLADDRGWCKFAGSAGWLGVGPLMVFFTTGRVHLGPDGSVAVGPRGPDEARCETAAVSGPRSADR